MFDVDSGRAAKYVDILLDMQALAIKMIRWYCCETKNRMELEYKDLARDSCRAKGR